MTNLVLPHLCSERAGPRANARSPLRSCGHRTCCARRVPSAMPSAMPFTGLGGGSRKQNTIPKHDSVTCACNAKPTLACYARCSSQRVRANTHTHSHTLSLSRSRSCSPTPNSLFQTPLSHLAASACSWQLLSLALGREFHKSHLSSDCFPVQCPHTGRFQQSPSSQWRARLMLRWFFPRSYAAREVGDEFQISPQHFAHLVVSLG